MTSDVQGGPGWVIRGEDLRPSITDQAMFRRSHAEDELVDVLELLWSGRPAEALQHLSSFPETVRVRALTADCHRDLGRHDRALDSYDALVAETMGTPREAMMRQHRGKTLLAAGHPERAVEDFRRAAQLRAGGDPALLASTQQALEVAEAAVMRRQQG